MEKLIDILEELHPEVDFRVQTGLVDDGILDSFDVITLVSEIEDAYGVQITAQELIPEYFNSAYALFGLIRQLSER